MRQGYFAAITQDQIIVRDGQAIDTHIVGGFSMPGGEWAVHFDSVTGMGEVEYIDNRINEKITVNEFRSRYSYLIDIHDKAVKEAKRLADEAEEA